MLRELEESRTDDEWRRSGRFFLAGYCGSLRGFEVPKIVLTELKNQVQLEPTNHVPAHVGLPL